MKTFHFDGKQNRPAEHYSVKITLLCDFDGYISVKNQFLRLHAPSKTRVTGFLTDIPGHFIFKRRFSFLLFPSKINEPFLLTESKNRSAELYSVKIPLSCDFDGTNTILPLHSIHKRPILKPFTQTQPLPQPLKTR